MEPILVIVLLGMIQKGERFSFLTSMITLQSKEEASTERTAKPCVWNKKMEKRKNKLEGVGAAKART